MELLSVFYLSNIYKLVQVFLGLAMILTTNINYFKMPLLISFKLMTASVLYRTKNMLINATFYI